MGPRLRTLLVAVSALFALAAASAVYLVGVRLAGWATGTSFSSFVSVSIFLVHLVLGLLMVVPVLVFGLAHMRVARRLPNRRAARVGYGLFATAVVLIASGLVLTRIEGVLEIKDPVVRSVAYWIHLASPLVAAWLFVLHRLAGKPIRWRIGLGWLAAATAMAGGILVWQAQDPRRWVTEPNPEGDAYFAPSLARTGSGQFISGDVLMMDSYCRECHPDVHERWSEGVHRFSSFNNPPYRFSVRNTREVALARDGSVRASRFCAGCHDPVPLFAGSFSDPDYDDENDPTAHAGITCTVCHSITRINSVRGNADYTIEPPVHYPFTFSENRTLRWLNRQLIKAKPELHRRTFLKPLHQTAEFCGTCHKVHLPPELNAYKWLRGQNHYDAFLLSGVSGHGVASFYYPDVAKSSCNGCHMPLEPSDDFGARYFDSSGHRTVHDHLFPSANTAIPVLVGLDSADDVIAAHRKISEGSVRVDIFGARAEGRIDGELIAPLRPEIPTLVAGRTYLFEVVLRTLTLGHILTQGTADSNELWLDITVTADGRVIGRSGGVDAGGELDPWSHKVNAYVLDRYGNRIDRRNAEDIFIPLYSNQIPPGAADSVHYRLTIPPDVAGPITIEAALRYRKFDTTYMRLVYGEGFENRLPVMTLGQDRLVLPLAGSVTGAGAGSSQVPQDQNAAGPEWQRWNDYGIGLLRKRETGQLRQAEEAFGRVEALGRPDGPLNLARVYLREGRITTEAPAALERAAAFDPPGNAWTVLWLSALVKRQNGNLDEAIVDLEQILEGGFAQAAGRGFDFSRDYRVLDELGGALYQRALLERGPARMGQRRALMRQSETAFLKALVQDPENLAAHWGLKQVYADLGEADKAEEHAIAHERYRPDDNARDAATTAARRRDPAADHAAAGVVIYDLQRDDEGRYRHRVDGLEKGASHDA